MTEYVEKQAAIEAVKSDPMGGLNYKRILTDLPAADVVPVTEIYDAGYKGKEVQFRIGGRLFAIRELAQ